MTMTQVAPPYPLFTDSDGSPLDSGYIYLGFVNMNPETNPIPAYWDEALTLPAAQPIRTVNGYPARNGTPAKLYTDGTFSITLRNKKQEIVFYSPVGYAVSASSVAASSAITTVANNINSVNTVAGSMGNVNTVATDIANVNAVGANIASVNTVASNIANVNAVAGNATNINAVAANATNINTVATNNANVTTVATNISSVNNTSANMAAVIDAPNQAAAAAASAAAAAASAASGMYSAVQDKSADYTVVLGDAGDLIRMTTTGGARTVTLPQISTLPDGFNVTVVKWTGDANAVTVTRSGSDLINGSTTYVLDAQYKSATFVADKESSTWFASGSGSTSTNIVVDPFTGNGTVGPYTLSGDPGTKNNTLINVGGAFQLKSAYSLSGTQITFTSAVPNGVAFEVQWSQPLAIGTPADGTVTTVKLADNALAATVAGLAKMADGFLQATTAGLAKMADGFLAATTAGRAKMADLFVTTAKLDDLAVTTAKLADANVTAVKLASGAAVSNIGTGGITATQLASDAVTTAKILDANVTPAKLSQKLTLATAVNTTSGTAIDFTSIPSWVKRITVMFAGVSVSGTSNLLIQLGAGSVTTSGYSGGAWAANTVNTTSTAGMLVTGTNEATRKMNGVMTICNMGSNTWAESVVTFDNVNNNGGNGGGFITLAGTLDRIRLTTVNGTDTFDAGSVNILYEG